MSDKPNEPMGTCLNGMPHTFEECIRKEHWRPLPTAPVDAPPAKEQPTCKCGHSKTMHSEYGCFQNGEEQSGSNFKECNHCECREFRLRTPLPATPAAPPQDVREVGEKYIQFITKSYDHIGDSADDADAKIRICEQAVALVDFVWEIATEKMECGHAVACRRIVGQTVAGCSACEEIDAIQRKIRDTAERPAPAYDGTKECKHHTPHGRACAQCGDMRGDGETHYSAPVAPAAPPQDVQAAIALLRIDATNLRKTSDRYDWESANAIDLVCASAERPAPDDPRYVAGTCPTCGAQPAQAERQVAGVDEIIEACANEVRPTHDDTDINEILTNCQAYIRKLKGTFSLPAERVSAEELRDIILQGFPSQEVVDYFDFPGRMGDIIAALRPTHTPESGENTK